RAAERHVAVDDLDRLNADRAIRAGPFLLARLALHQRGEIPAAVFHLSRRDVRPRQPDPADGDALLHELADAVGECDLVNLHERAPVAVEGDVAELEAAKERAF